MAQQRHFLNSSGDPGMPMFATLASWPALDALLVAPSGQDFLVDDDGNYLIDDDGNYLTGDE